MKKIEITGKRNIDSFSKKKEKKRKSFLDINMKDICSNYIFNPKNQIMFVNKLYLQEEFEGIVYAKKEITKKILGYKMQDTRKKISLKELITYEECIEKLVLSKLKCHYCLCNCILLYENVREKKQWTLDRLNNDIGHSSDNTVICCLECNLKKRTTGENEFKFAKQLRVIKGF